MLIKITLDRIKTPSLSGTTLSHGSPIITTVTYTKILMKRLRLETTVDKEVFTETLSLLPFNQVIEPEDCQQGN